LESSQVGAHLFLETSAGAVKCHRNGVCRGAEQLGYLGIVEILEVAQGEDLGAAPADPGQRAAQVIVEFVPEVAAIGLRGGIATGGVSGNLQRHPILDPSRLDDIESGVWSNYPGLTGIPGLGTNAFSDSEDVPRRYYRIQVDLP
jgi:hypothetical protein